jgi:hypothetical protein
LAGRTIPAALTHGSSRRQHRPCDCSREASPCKRPAAIDPEETFTILISPPQSRQSDVALALTPPPARLFAAIVRSAALGLTAFGAHDLTNFATLRGYTVAMTIMDMAWGTFATALGGGAACALVYARR